MLDAYSRLGAYAGLAGKFPPLGIFHAGHRLQPQPVRNGGAVVLVGLVAVLA